MNSQVSVVIPTFNRVALLERAIRSCLAQTVPVMEILVCDDGSTDGSEAMVRALGDHRVKWCGGERGGRPAIPRNRGIRHSRGDWVAFLDDDDEWLPDKIEHQLALAARLGCDAVCSNAYRMQPDGREAGLLLRTDGPRETFRSLLALNQVICSSAMVRKELLARVGGFPEDEGLIVGEDYALWLRIATLTDFALVESPLLRYRDDPDHSIRRGNDDLMQKGNVYTDFLCWASGQRALWPFVRRVRRRLNELRHGTLRERCRGWMCRVLGGGP